MKKIKIVFFILSITLYVTNIIFPHSAYVALMGFCMAYICMNYSAWKRTGKADAVLMLLTVSAILLILLKMKYHTMWITWILFVLQVVIFLRFLDPVLEAIALRHREKRLEENNNRLKKELSGVDDISGESS